MTDHCTLQVLQKFYWTKVTGQTHSFTIESGQTGQTTIPLKEQEFDER